MARLGRLLQALLVGLLSLYQYFLSPLLHRLAGGGCRFAPSCSEYAREAIRLHGPLVGLYYSLRRLGRCHPFHPGGYDPPPQRSM